MSSKLHNEVAAPAGWFDGSISRLLSRGLKKVVARRKPGRLPRQLVASVRHHFAASSTDNRERWWHVHGQSIDRSGCPNQLSETERTHVHYEDARRTPWHRVLL